MCRLNLRDYLARPKQHSSGDGSSSLSSSPLLSFSPPLHTSPQQVLLSSFCWLPWLAQACWSMLPKSACRRSPPRSLLPRSSLKPNHNIQHWASACPTIILLNVFCGLFCVPWLALRSIVNLIQANLMWSIDICIILSTSIYLCRIYINSVFSDSPGFLSSCFEDFPAVWGLLQHHHHQTYILPHNPPYEDDIKATFHTSFFSWQLQ